MTFTVHTGDALTVLRAMADESVHCCVTSPPYWGLRDYGVDGQLGLEATPAEYVAAMVAVFREVRRVLRGDGTLWLNLGDSYSGNASPGGEATRTCDSAPNATIPIHLTKRGDGLKAKDLCGIPWSVAFALRAEGWYLRKDIIWSKPNPMPESVTDRPTTAHEYLFLLSKSERYYYNADAIAEAASSFGLNDGGYDCPGQTPHATSRGVLPVDPPTTRNRRSVWEIATEPFPGAHFAVMPTALVRPCVLAGCPTGGTVLDPFTGSGTVGVVAMREGCAFVGVELNPKYADMARRRIGNETPASLLPKEAP